MTQLILSCNIAGLTHARPDFNKMKEGDTVRLIAEPNNQYDPAAVRVEHPVAGKLGYIPKDQTRIYHDANKNLLQITARIGELDDSGKYPKCLLLASVSL